MGVDNKSQGVKQKIICVRIIHKPACHRQGRHVQPTGRRCAVCSLRNLCEALQRRGRCGAGRLPSLREFASTAIRLLPRRGGSGRPNGGRSGRACSDIPTEVQGGSEGETSPSLKKQNTQMGSAPRPTAFSQTRPLATKKH